MISNLTPYPAYRDSGVPWLGEIPAHWKELPLRAVTKPKNVRGRPDLPLLSVYRDYGVIPRDSRDDNYNPRGQDLSSYKIVSPGDLVLNKMKTWQGSLGVSQHTGIVSPAYIVCQLSENLHHPSLHFVLRSRQYIDHYNRLSFGVRVNQWDMRYEDFKQIPIFLPPLSEQAAIARFLDHVDRRIRRYIRAKRKLIALLEEQKQAIIHRAVTRGLDPDVRLKPSGVEWLGEIPEHWEVRRVKNVSQVLRGKFTHRPRNDPSLYDGPYPFIQTGEVARANKAITSYKQTLNERGLAVSKMFPSGTLVMTIAANIGDVAVLDFEACFPDSVVGLFPRKNVERDFLYYFFCAMKPELVREAPVNTQGNLNVDRIGSRVIAIPPVREQQEIIQYVESNTASLDLAILSAQQQVDLLREYRTRLIADVVTGKLDVRQAAAHLPEEAEEPVELDEVEEMDEDETLVNNDQEEDA